MLIHLLRILYQRIESGMGNIISFSFAVMDDKKEFQHLRQREKSYLLTSTPEEDSDKLSYSGQSD